jgi:hypothetical protein
MKKLKFIIAIVLVGALVLTKASTTFATDAGSAEEKDFNFMIYGEASNESLTVNFLQDTYYKVAVPSFIELADLQKISYNYFYDDIQVTGDEGVDVGADSTPFEISATGGFLSSFAARFWAVEGSDMVIDGSVGTSSTWMSNPDIINVNYLEYSQNDIVIYALGENTTSTQLNNLYILKNAVKYQPSSSINYQDNYNLITLQFVFRTDTYGDTAYYEGYNQGSIVGREDGLIDGESIGQDNYTPTGAWEYENNDLFIFTQDGTRFGIGDGPYLYASDEGYSEGLSDNTFGYDEGFADGVDEGYDEGISNTSFGFDWISGFFGMFGALFSVELIPGLTIGLIVGVPIAFRLTLGIIRMIRGG